MPLPKPPAPPPPPPPRIIREDIDFGRVVRVVKAILKTIFRRKQYYEHFGD